MRIMDYANLVFTHFLGVTHAMLGIMWGLFLTGIFVIGCAGFFLRCFKLLAQ